VHVAYQGQLGHDVAPPGRRVEVGVAIRDGHLRFHPDWPEATALAGLVRVTPDATFADIGSGRVGDIAVAGGRVQVPAGAAEVRIDLHGETDAADLMGFLRQSPIAAAMPDATASWTAAGPRTYDAALVIPVGGASGELAVDVQATLAGVDLDMADVGLRFAGLRGPLGYVYPHAFESARLDGVLFERPVRVAASTRDDALRFDVAGRMDGTELRRWLPATDGLMHGELAFEAAMHVDAGGRRAPHLTIRSDLVGTAVMLPSVLGKAPAESRETHVMLTFLADELRLELEMAPLGAAWVGFEQGRIVRGAVGFGITPPGPEQVLDELWVGGRLEELDVGPLLAAGDGAARATAALNWRIDGLTVDRLRHEAVAFEAVEIDGTSRDGHTELQVASPALAGMVRIAPEQPIEIDFDRLHLPAVAGGEASDAGTSLAARLAALDRRAWPDVDARLGDLRIADAELGSWRFAMRRSDRSVRFENLVAEVRGLRVDAPTGIIWGDDDTAAFVGRVEATNLAEVLPQWGYAPSIESRSASVDAALAWPGSPIDLDLAGLTGRMNLAIGNGRFLDVHAGSGAQRILSLLNLTKIARRMTMDFSDVFGRGISFDELSGRFDLAGGVLTFTEPMRVEGTGSAFRISGQVDLLEGLLDNEMIVTLPVSENLPWYAAYLAVANPLMAGAVLVGERIFRSQIEQMSSAKYRIEGTLDDPQVALVRVFASETRSEALSSADAPEAGARTETPAPDVDDEMMD
jgi:uncharacterized protein YhdP